MKLVPSLAAALALAGCAVHPTSDGRILAYLRSNADGSQPESVEVFQKDPLTVEVYKHVAPCTRAALVTARFDPAAEEALSLVGGRLTREGTQAAFAWLDLDPDTRQLAVRMIEPDAEPDQVLNLPVTAPWRLYDFDFADFNANARPPMRGAELTWEMALVWPDDAPTSALKALGTLSASW